MNVTDPDSRLMKDSRKAIQPSYNGQIAVDDKEQVERNLGALPKEGSADAGYSSYDNLEFAEVKGLDTYMPDNFLDSLDEKEEGEKRYHKSNFRYDEARDTYVCPEGRDLIRWAEQKREGKVPLLLYRGESCRECAVREQCTAGEARTVSRDGREPLLEAMRQKLRSEEGKRIYEKRGYTAEPVFGQIKWNGRKPSMDLRGSVKVRGEFLLKCLVHNVKRSVKKVLEGTVSLPGKYSRLIEEAMLEYKEEQLTLVGAEV